MTLKKIVLVLMFLSGSSTSLFAQLPPGAVHKENARLERFKSLNGPDQVQMFFKEAFGKGMFWKQLTALPFDLSFEQQILVSSPDLTINHALVLKAKQTEPSQARYAIYLIGLRARFVPHSEFPIQQMNGTYGAFEFGSNGSISPFAPNFDRVGKEASDVVKEALASADVKLQTTAKLYSGELQKELVLLPASELAMRWRAELGKLPAPIDYFVDLSETSELVRVLERSLGAKGLEAAVAISSLLEKESKPWPRELEIALIEHIDASAVRLRGSQQGRDAIRVVGRILATQKLWLYQSGADRQHYWQTLQDQFFRDRFSCSLNSWATVMAFAFDQFHGEHLTFPLPHGGGGRGCNDKLMTAFLSYLTEIDPTFPSWEFPSTGSQDDMLHPRFAAKVARYHDAWVKMNLAP